MKRFKNRRISFFTLLGILLVAGIFYLAYYDAALPSDEDMRMPPSRPIAASDNAALVLERLRPKATLAKFPELQSRYTLKQFDDLISNKTDLDSEAYGILRKANDETLTVFWKASEKPDMQFGAESANVMGMIRTVRLLDFFWQNMRHEAQAKQACEEAIRVLEFATRIGAAEGHLTVNMLAALAMISISNRYIVANVDSINDRDECLAISIRICSCEIPRVELENLVKGEYHYFPKELHSSDPLKDASRLKKCFWPYIFKPNTTHVIFLDYYREVLIGLKNSNLPDVEIYLKKLSIQRYKPIGILLPNSSGEKFVFERLIGFDGIYNSFNINLTKTRQLACAFALRAYWLDHGKLPQTLELLVPAYLKTVPEDPFIGMPMAYDAAKALLYCAGPDQIIDNGAYALAPGAEPFGKRPFIIMDWAKTAKKDE